MHEFNRRAPDADENEHTDAETTERFAASTRTPDGEVPEADPGHRPPARAAIEQLLDGDARVRRAPDAATQAAEREADRAADAVLRPAAQTGDERIQRAPDRDAGAPIIRRSPAIGAEGGLLGTDDEQAITRIRRSGQPLPAPVRREMESAFEADFSAVRLHVGRDSDALNDQLQARAFTCGNDVFVRRSEYTPSTDPGKRLLAHELAHTLQQGTPRAPGSEPPVVQRKGLKGLLKGVFSAFGSKSEDEGELELPARAEPAEDTVPAPPPRDRTGRRAPAPPQPRPDEVVLYGSTTAPANAVAVLLRMRRGRVNQRLTEWGLTFDNGFVRQARVSIGGDPTNAVLLRWNSDWGRQPRGHGTVTIDQIDGIAAVTALKALPGWGRMPVGDRSKLERLLIGATNQLSASVRNYVRGRLATIQSETADRQATTLSGLLVLKDAIPEEVQESVAATRVDYTLGTPRVVRNYQFRPNRANADKYQVDYRDGTKVFIVAAQTPDVDHHNHTVRQVAEAAAFLPAPARQAVRTIQLNPVVNPDDAHWAVEYSIPNFHSYMTAGERGDVVIYPNRTTQPLAADQIIKSSLIHETGHTWSYRTWGEDTTRGKWRDWRRAMTNDKMSVSGYAMAAIDEDVAETICVYVATKGTPRFDEYKRIVSQRFAILDQEYK